MSDIGFLKTKKKQNEHINNMFRESDALYTVNLDKQELFNSIYLGSFPKGTNEIFRERTEHDCNACKHFFNRIGNVVSIKDGVITTVWGVDGLEGEYAIVFKALDEYVKKHIVSEVWFSDQKNIWRNVDHEEDKVKKIMYKWEHFYVDVPDKFVIEESLTRNKKVSDMNGSATAFYNSLNEINSFAVDTVIELIETNTLYKGKEYEWIVKKFKEYKDVYDTLDDSIKRNWAWEKSVSAGEIVCRIKNHAIGTLLKDITDGMELDDAVKAYGFKVDPVNYKHSKTVFSNRQIEEAQKTIAELGYMDSLGRRFATIDDITVNNILYCNRDSAKKITGAMSLFDDLKKDAKSKQNPKELSNVQEITAKDFIDTVLPKARNVELYLDNEHESNMCSLIAPMDSYAPSMFKWNNPVSWAYHNNITDVSDITKRVIEKGGRVDVPLRFSHSWNYEGMRNASLMDLHVFLPTHRSSSVKENYDVPVDGKKEIHDFYGNNSRVGWNNRTHSKTGGQQDVDYTSPAPSGYIPVENTVFPDMSKLPEGKYVFKIHNWKLRQPTNGGFKAELAFNGTVYNFTYKKPLENKEWITVAILNLKNGVFDIEYMMPTDDSEPIEIWNLKTKQFVPVSVICYSPNYWDEQNGIGNKHLMFMLKDCINDEHPNGFYNEYLKDELYKNHRRVFEALGQKCKVEESDNQLSGVGFSMTKRADVIVKVKTDNTERKYCIKF